MAKRTTAENNASQDAQVTMDRRTGSKERRQKNTDVPVERRKVQRRRQIDPTTCERDYTGEEIEFMQALDEYKRRSGRMFPTCSEILEVIRSLGYERASQPEPETGKSTVVEEEEDA